MQVDQLSVHPSAMAISPEEEIEKMPVFDPLHGDGTSGW
jgi:hypothetical protein